MRPPTRPRLPLLALALSVPLGCGDDGSGSAGAELPLTSASQGLSGAASSSTSAGADADTGTSTGTSAEGSTTASETTAPEFDDDAALVALTLPTSLACGAEGAGTITLRNTGSTPWTRDAGHKLAAVDDSDPLALATRVELPYDVVVAPGDEHSFAVDLTAPAAADLYVSDWQMVREGVQWFGEVAAADVAVSCGDPNEPPALDLDAVIWLHTDVSAWPQTMTLASVTFDGAQICLNHGGDDEGAFVWPIELLNGDTEVVGNPWVFIYRDGAWYGATWEWLRPSQTCKAATSVAGDHIKQAPFDAGSGWTPSSGETLYFMVSALARLPEMTNVSERSNPVKVVWP
ncbi:MAG: NBR1-Ig-like domain-containing protein [Nannocystaceae bacterium]